MLEKLNDLPPGRSQMIAQRANFVPPRRTETFGPFVDVNSWTAAGSELRIRILRNRTPSPEVDQALANEVERLEAIQSGAAREPQKR